MTRHPPSRAPAVVHVAVTEHPTAEWTAQQLRNAFPWDYAPRYRIRDHDHAFAGCAQTAKAMGIEEVVTAPRSPWQNPYAEHFIGSARRDCLDHVIVCHAAGLQRLMQHYCAYYEQARSSTIATSAVDSPSQLLNRLADFSGPFL